MSTETLNKLRNLHKSNPEMEKQLSQIAKFVLQTLADRADKTGYCWPSNDCLATYCHVSLRSVQRAMKTMMALELIQKEQRHDSNGRTLDGYYVLAQIEKYTKETELSDSQSLPRDSQSSPRDSQSLLYIETSYKRSLETNTAASQKTDAAHGVLDRKKTLFKQELQWLVRWFAWAIEQVTGAKYMLTKIDTHIMKGFLDCFGFEQTLNRASYYLTLPETKRWPQGSPTFRGLQHQINVIGGKDSPETDEICIQMGILPLGEQFENILKWTPWSNKTAA